MIFQEFIEDLGFETRAYSGRGMYGKECLAFNSEAPLKDIQEISYCLGQHNAENEDDEIPRPGRVEFDSMGTEYIVYWPALPFGETL